MPRLSRIAAAAVLALAVTPAVARGESSWSVGGGVWGVSDYIWRGVSQTQEDPTWQAEVAAEHVSGFYAGLFLSGVDFTPSGADWDDGIDFEANAYLGWSQEISDTLSIDLGYTRVFYPGFKDGYDADFNEFSAALGFFEHYTATVVYSENAINLGSSAWYYNLAGEWELGESGLTLAAAAGHYDLGPALGGSYNDYELSLARSFGPVAVKLAWTDTASYGDELAEYLGEQALAKGRAVLSVGYEF